MQDKQKKYKPHTAKTAARIKAQPIFWLASALLLAACSHSPSDSSGTVGTGTLNVADAAINSGDPNMALSVSQSVLATDATNVDALEHEGDAYYALGRCPAAEAAFNLALKNNPKATTAATGLGRCLLKTNPPAAEAAFETAVQDDPGNANAWNDLGIARDLQDNFAGAVAPYQKALLANPQLTAAEVNLGLSYALSGDGEDALEYLGPLATGQGATPKIREDYAAALVASGRTAEARQVLAVDLTPDQVDQAVRGFSTLIANAQSNPPPPPPPPATMAQMPETPVTAAPITQSTAPTPLTPPARQMAAATPAAPAETSTPASAKPADLNAAYAGPSPLPGAVATPTGNPPPPAAMASPAPKPAMPPTPAPAPAPAMQASSPGGAAVQLGALNSPGAANAAWNHISGAEPALFSGKSPEVEPVTVHGKKYYRLRIGGFASRSDAASFCAQLSASGKACTVANF